MDSLLVEVSFGILHTRILFSKSMLQEGLLDFEMFLLSLSEIIFMGLLPQLPIFGMLQIFLLKLRSLLLHNLDLIITQSDIEFSFYFEQ